MSTGELSDDQSKEIELFHLDKVSTLATRIDL